MIMLIVGTVLLHANVEAAALPPSTGPQTITVKEGATEKVDLDGDGTPDMSITLDEAYPDEDYADISFEVIAEPKSAESASSDWIDPDTGEPFTGDVELEPLEPLTPPPSSTTLPPSIIPEVKEPISNCPGGTVFCGGGIDRGTELTKQYIDKAIYTGFDLKQLMIAWIRFLFPIAAIAAVIALIWAGFMYITAFGDDAQVDKAKNIIIWVVAGIILILGAFAIVNTIIGGVV